MRGDEHRLWFCRRQLFPIWSRLWSSSRVRLASRTSFVVQHAMTAISPATNQKITFQVPRNWGLGRAIERKEQSYHKRKESGAGESCQIELPPFRVRNRACHVSEHPVSWSRRFGATRGQGNLPKSGRGGAGERFAVTMVMHAVTTICLAAKQAPTSTNVDA